MARIRATSARRIEGLRSGSSRGGRARPGRCAGGHRVPWGCSGSRRRTEPAAHTRRETGGRGPACPSPEDFARILSGASAPHPADDLVPRPQRELGPASSADDRHRAAVLRPGILGPSRAPPAGPCRRRWSRCARRRRRWRPGTSRAALARRWPSARLYSRVPRSSAWPSSCTVTAGYCGEPGGLASAAIGRWSARMLLCRCRSRRGRPRWRSGLPGCPGGWCCRWSRHRRRSPPCRSPTAGGEQREGRERAEHLGVHHPLVLPNGQQRCG